MSTPQKDAFQQFLDSPAGKFLAPKVGLPQPEKLRLSLIHI